tara:strand:+ start:187 stop:1020 length:834 start_codon:yes stop_codon:yes gene_type:complete
MENLPGYSIRPSAITASGEVYFTDGTITVVPNQPACEAYGYRYDSSTGTCRAFTFSTNLGRNLINENNMVQGAGNVTESGTNNTYIMGEANTVKGDSRNNIIIGNNNEIANGVSTASVLGSYGFAQRDGEVVIGGGGFSGAGKGYAQSSVVTLTGTTTDATATKLFVNGNSSITTIARDANAITTSFTGFEANVMGVRTGGTAAGSVNDRILLRATGIVYEKAPNQSVSTLGSTGTVTGWTAAVGFSGSFDMDFQVTGAANMNISWSCTLNLYEIKI